MSYSVDWITKIITIPTTDLTLIGGTRYSLAMGDFMNEIRRLEWQPDEGLWALDILDHTNKKIDFAGADYAGFDDIINGYTIQITGVATRCDLLGSNTNFVDVLISTGVSVVPSNSGGLIQAPAISDEDITLISEGVSNDIINPPPPADLTPELTIIKLFFSQKYKHSNLNYKLKINSAQKEVIKLEIGISPADDLINLNISGYSLEIIIDETLVGNDFVIYGTA
mgnify:CR=1 FL=1|tara:strand:+ start:4373 stop:5047 length:675 start_codon:yes stop_codon:yes gene_type:complete